MSDRSRTYRHFAKRPAQWISKYHEKINKNEASMPEKKPKWKKKRDRAAKVWQKQRSITALLDQIHEYRPIIPAEAEAIMMNKETWAAIQSLVDPVPRDEDGTSEPTLQGWTVKIHDDIPDGEIRFMV